MEFHTFSGNISRSATKDRYDKMNDSFPTLPSLCQRITILQLSRLSMMANDSILIPCSLNTFPPS